MSNSIQLEQQGSPLVPDSGLERIQMHFGGSRAVVYLQGAQVVEYAPAGQNNILWVSGDSQFQPGKAIRGGIPVCWPWFGAHSRQDRPQHGFARQGLFDLILSESTADFVRVVLRLPAGQAPFEEWRNNLQLDVEIRLSDKLWMEMRATNLSEKTLAISNCLHSYFAVEDARLVQLPKLQGKAYLDKTLNFEHCVQSTAFAVGEEVDRVYLENPEQIQIIDSVADHQIEVSTWGFEHLVVWNPWQEKAQAMQDFDNNGYLKMLCVEPANALPESVQLAPGETHHSGQCILLTG